MSSYLEMSATESMEIKKYGESDKHVVARFLAESCDFCNFCNQREMDKHAAKNLSSTEHLMKSQSGFYSQLLLPACHSVS